MRIQSHPLYDEAVTQFCFRYNIDPDDFYLPLYEEEIIRLMEEMLEEQQLQYQF